MKIGICGGTFDPFHRGHLDPILAVRDALQWDRVIYVPAYVQPFKQDRRTASGYHRFAMAVLGTEPHEGLEVTPLELERGAISYTVDTLQHLRGTYADATIDWIIGDDNLAQLHEWKSIETIARLTNFVVLARAGSARVLPPDMSGILGIRAAGERPAWGSVVFAENAMIPISSTEVRRRVREGDPIEDLVPPPVARYIHHYDLYRKGQA